MRPSVVMASVILCFGCAPSDGDGNAPPPADLDSDGDGLTDLEEATHGSDPQVVDSDGDGYGDGDEVVEGHSPTDAEDRIYIGHWPYNPDKDDIEDPGWDSTPAVGAVMPRFRAVDQYGEEVDLYDFAYQGRPIAIEVGTRFCTPCKEVAAFYSNNDSSILEDDYPWWRDEYADVRRQIEEGEIYWITVLFSAGTPADAEDTAWWHEQWPNHKIAVLADTELTLKNYLNVGSMPHVLVLDEAMRFLVYNVRGPTHGFNYLVGN